jgi:hypothetical protein
MHDIATVQTTGKTAYVTTCNCIAIDIYPAADDPYGMVKPSGTPRFSAEGSLLIRNYGPYSVFRKLAPVTFAPLCHLGDSLGDDCTSNSRIEGSRQWTTGILNFAPRIFDRNADNFDRRRIEAVF